MRIRRRPCEALAWIARYDDARGARVRIRFVVASTQARPGAAIAAPACPRPEGRGRDRAAPLRQLKPARPAGPSSRGPSPPGTCRWTRPARDARPSAPSPTAMPKNAAPTATRCRERPGRRARQSSRGCGTRTARRFRKSAGTIRCANSAGMSSTGGRARVRTSPRGTARISRPARAAISSTASARRRPDGSRERACPR